MPAICNVRGVSVVHGPPPPPYGLGFDYYVLLEVLQKDRYEGKETKHLEKRSDGAK